MTRLLSREGGCLQQRWTSLSRTALNSLQALIAVVALWLAASVPTRADGHVALVVGNSAYKNVATLPNPVNDAQDIGTALQQLGYQVILGLDVDKAGFDKRLHEFSQAAATADVAMFFYAGHGLQAKGVNHLIPVDAKLTAETDLDFETETLDFVLKQMERAKTRIVFLDACRNNPFARGLARSLGTRALDEGSGLAVTVSAGLGTFIAYATQPGNVAGDGDGRNSPFTEPLKTRIGTPGLSITDLMMEVRNAVSVKTNGAQVPWEHSALSSRFFFKEGAAIAFDAATVKSSEAAEAWGWVQKSDNPAMLDEFVRRYADTSFGPLAERRLTEVRQVKAPQQPAPVISGLKEMSLKPVKPSFDCKEHYKDAEVTICNNPELSIFDNEIDRLYVSAAHTAKPDAKKKMVEEQRAWIEVRNACGTDVKCLMDQHRSRIERLRGGAKTAAKPAPPPALPGGGKPDFDCTTHFQPAEIAVCSDGELARIDVDLNKAYTRANQGLNAERKKVLLAEQRQWLRTRDSCGNDVACLKIQYQARLQQLANWK